MNYLKKIIQKIREGFLQEVIKETKWIYQLTRQYLLQVIIYTFLSLLSVGCSMFITVKMKSIVDALVEYRVSEIANIAVIYAIFGTSNVILTMITQRVAYTINLRVNKEVRVDIFSKIMISDWESLAEYHSGDLLARINDDVKNISNSVIGWVPTLLINGFQLLFTVALIIFYDPSMLFLLAVCAPIMVFGSRIFLSKMYQSNKEMREIASEVMTFDKDAFHNIQTVKAFGLTSLFCNKMLHIQERNVEIGLKYNKYSVLSWAVMYVSGQMAAMVCLGWTVFHVHTGKVTIGTMALFLMLATYISSAFKTLVQLVPNAIAAVASATRVRTLIDLPVEVNEEERKVRNLCVNGFLQGITIEINHLDFAYKNGKQVFKNVSLKASPGEIIALVGPSGEGKTTMLRVLLGLIKKQSGEAIMYLGNNIEQRAKINPGTRKLIAYVPQGNTMMAGTIAENMRLVAPEATEDEIIEALKQSCAYEFVSLLPEGIHHRVGESGIGFSEGQNQRLSIARAYLCKAPILMLDEATSALDVATERKVLKNLMSTDKYRTCILTTHRPSVLNICDRVYRIADGSIHAIKEEEIERLVRDF